jgi:branched-chain amino acid aminotransferase
MDFKFVNTRFEKVDQIETSNRGFLYGDGFFETMLIIDGYPTFWIERSGRIERTLEFLQLRLNCGINSLLKGLTEAAKEHDKSFLRARLSFVRRGNGKYLPDDSGCDIYLSLEVLNSLDFNQLSAKKTAFASLILPTDSAGNFKLIAKHYQVLAALEAKQKQLDDLVILNSNDQVAETISGNVFIIKDGKLRTPPLFSGCLDGVVRRVIIQNEGCAESVIKRNDILEADAVFTTNSISGIVPLMLHSNSNTDNFWIDKMKAKLKESLINSVRGLQENQL